jgi:type VI secretion system protein ImpH
MARASRRQNSSLKARLFEQPQTFEFFQAVRLLEIAAASESRGSAAEPPDPVGRGVEPRNAALTIRSSVPLGYASAEVTAVRQPRSGGPVEMTQSLIGLTGPSGVLPHALSEMVQVSVRERNPALRDFLDLFNNRFAGLLYDAWAKYRIVIERERSLHLGTPGSIDTALRAIVGVALPGMIERTHTPDATLVHFGGLLSRESRSALAVANALAGALRHEVRIDQFVGEWLPIAQSDRSRLADSASPQGNFARLGHDAVIGSRTYDIQSTVRIRIGPLGYADFRSLLPDGTRARMLSDMAAIALGADKVFRIRLELKPAEVPGLRLGTDRDSPTASRLGWNSWIGTRGPRWQSAVAEFRPAPHLR